MRNRFAHPTSAITPGGRVVTSAPAVISPPACVYVTISMAKAAIIRRTLTQVKLAVQSRAFLAMNHSFTRTRLTLIDMAAMGRLGIPMIDARLCRGWLILNMAAIASPMPAASRKYKPILPAVVLTCDQIAKARVQELTAQAINI